jgi:hypothetical protein
MTKRTVSGIVAQTMNCANYQLGADIDNGV